MGRHLAEMHFYVKIISLSFFCYQLIIFQHCVLSLDRSDGDVGSPHELLCDLPGQMVVSWWKDERPIEDYDRLGWERSDRTLTSRALQGIDAGNYTCVSRDGEYTQLLVVRTPPARLEKVGVHASTVVATVHWVMGYDGGYPILHFTLLYRPLRPTNGTQEGEEEGEVGNWHVPVPSHIGPDERKFFVYRLKPGTTYAFRLWASNRLGPGDPVTVHTTTAGDGSDEGQVQQQMLQASEGDLDFGTSAWVIAVSMVMGTVLLLSCLSCILIYKEGRNGVHRNEDEAHIITNPFDAEESPLLEQHADLNDNTERPIRLVNNNSVVRPSRV